VLEHFLCINLLMFSLSTGVVSEVSSIAISSIAVAKEFSLNDDGRIGDEGLLRKTTAGGYHGRAVIFVEMPSPRVSLQLFVSLKEGPVNGDVSV